MKIENTNIIVGSEVDANFFGNGERMLAATLRLKGVKQAIIDGCEQMFKDEFPDINLVHIFSLPSILGGPKYFRMNTFGKLLQAINYPWASPASKVQINSIDPSVLPCLCVL